MLDGVDEPVTVEELEAVVHRAGQRRRATLVAGAAALLTLGGLVGALARGPVVDDPPGGFAAESGDTPTPPMTAPVGPMAFPHGPMPGWTLTALFRREANGVAIRAYRSTLSPTAITVPEVPVDPACLPPTTIIRGEFSNGAAVGIGEGPERPGNGLLVLGSGEFGRDEGEPVAWAVVRAPAEAAAVRLKVGEAGDTMAPDKGIAVLTVPGGVAAGTVEAVAADGKVLASTSFPAGQSPMFSPACMPPPCPVIPADGGPVPMPAPRPPESAPPPGPPDASAPLPSAVGGTGSTVVTEAEVSCGSSGYGGEPPPPTSTTIAGTAAAPAAGGPLTTFPATMIAPPTTLAAPATTVPPTTAAPPASTAAPSAAP